MTEVYSYRAEVGSNWKLFIDAFVEFYHAPVLHQGQYTKEEAAKIQKYGFEALHYELSGPHSMISTWGGQAPPADLSMVKPMDRVLRSGLFGPWDDPISRGWISCRRGSTRPGCRSGASIRSCSSRISCC